LLGTQPIIVLQIDRVDKEGTNLDLDSLQGEGRWHGLREFEAVAQKLNWGLC
jgi:hypothetical protein